MKSMPSHSSPPPLEKKRGWAASIQLPLGGLVSATGKGVPSPRRQRPANPSAQLRRHCVRRGAASQPALSQDKELATATSSLVFTE